MFRTGLLAALTLTALLPMAASAAAPTAIRQVPITTPEGRLALLVSPTPVIRTDAAQTHAIVRVDNPSHLAEQVHVEIHDYVLDAAGTAQAVPQGYALGSAAWYGVDAPDFELAPGTSRDLLLTVAPPSTAGPGDHSASLDVRARAVTPVTPSGATGTTVESVLLVRNRLEHRIPGARPEAPDLRLAATVEGMTVHFDAQVTNPGNTVLSYQATGALPTIDLYETSMWADATRVARTLEPRGYYLAPQSERLASFDWLDGPLLASYRAVYSLPPFDGLPAVTAETTFTVVNLPVLSGIALGALGLVLLMTWATVRRRRARRRAAG
jgi:hypothetical protein